MKTPRAPFAGTYSCVLAALLTMSAVANAAAPLLRGSLGIHDPSTIVQCKDRFYIFGTGDNIPSKWSSDKAFWTAGPRVFSSPPAWTTAAVPGFVRTFWAPDVVYLNGKYCLYYSVSTWGSQVSAIGLVTNPTLDPSDPAYEWTDQGPVITSEVGSPYNTIDPGIVLDAQGNPWMCFGSYWNGIYVVQLDPQTGLRIAPDSPTYRVAYNSSIEASSILRRGAYYYLFVNWGSCCSGVNSTYNIRVGRSTSITGPYYDRNGVNMVNRGGHLFLEGTGKYAGPGHMAFVPEGNSLFFTYHYYDANAWSSGYDAHGQAQFDYRPLSWTSDGWPEFVNDWSAVYRFEYDARDDNGQYYGLLQGGASVERDSVRGGVFDLDGSGQMALLPPGVAYARTFTVVVKWNGGPAWQRIFDFGTDTSGYVMLTPASGNNRLRCDIRAGGVTQVLEAPNALPIGSWNQVAVTLDGSRGVLYLNGSPIATNNGMTLSPVNVRAQTNHLGRSKFVADADFNGQIAEFRAYGRVLSAQEIASPHPIIDEPLARSNYAPGSEIRFAGGATDLLKVPLPGNALTWRIEHVLNGQTNLVFGPLTGVTNGVFQIPSTAPASGVYRVTLGAVDGLGRAGTNYVEVLAIAASNSEWSSFYPFTTSALDASNRFNGALLNGASIQTDTERSKVLNLAGGSQHVVLPAGVANLQTLSAWVKWNGGAAWQRVYDFGSGTGRWLMLTPRDSDGNMQAAITSDRGDFVRVIRAPFELPAGSWVHLAVVYDGRQGILYTNGAVAAVNNSVNLYPSDLLANRNYFGRSQYTHDPYFNGRIDSVRIDSRPLAPAVLFGPTAVILQPTPGAKYAGGDTVFYSGGAYDYTDAPLPASALSWSAQLHHDSQVDPVFGPLNGVSGGSFVVPTTGPATTNAFYRLTLRVTGTAGNSQSVSADLQPQISLLSLDSVPSGFDLRLDGQLLTTPASIPAVAGLTRTVRAPSPQNVGGSNYSFVLWSDGGAATHTISTPATNTSLIASFLFPSLHFDFSDETLNLSWPAWAGSLALCSTTNLAPPVFWQPVSQSPEHSGDVLSIAFTITNGQSFFRLQPPGAAK